ncbi:MAG: hypothetical protein LBG66_00160 [Gallionellaceae bacterium]|jgi:hypothetical protein|nr:hypothetical protein [Gallionellaceae bacterium]
MHNEAFTSFPSDAFPEEAKCDAAADDMSPASEADSVPVAAEDDPAASSSDLTRLFLQRRGRYL